MLLIPAMPVVTVKKITGAIIIFTNLINASPSGFIASPTCGANVPNKIPTMIAIMTCTYSTLYQGLCYGGSTKVVVLIGIMAIHSFTWPSIHSHRSLWDSQQYFIYKKRYTVVNVTGWRHRPIYSQNLSNDKILLHKVIILCRLFAKLQSHFSWVS